MYFHFGFDEKKDPLIIHVYSRFFSFLVLFLHSYTLPSLFFLFSVLYFFLLFFPTSVMTSNGNGWCRLSVHEHGASFIIKSIKNRLRTSRNDVVRGKKTNIEKEKERINRKENKKEDTKS